MRSAWVRALHESPEDAESCVLLKKPAKKRLLRHHSEGARPTDRGLRSRGPPFPRFPAPRAPLSSVDLRLPSHRRERQAEQLSWHGLHRQHAAGLSTYASSYQPIASGARARQRKEGRGPGRLEQLLDTKGPAPAIAG